MALIYGNAINFVSASSQAARRTRVSVATDNHSVCFWLRVDTMPAGAATGWIYMNGGSSNNAGYGFYVNSSGIIICDMRFVSNACRTTTAISEDVWYHITWQRSSGTSQFYINGTADGNTAANAWNALQGSSATCLGAYADSDASGPSAGTYLDCTLDDVRVFDRAITSGEITTLYTNGNLWPYTDIDTTSQVAWWKMNEASGDPADSSGGGLTLTNLNTATFVTGIVATGSTGANNLSLLGVGA